MIKLKIGIIIPDRGDRPELLKNCLRMMNGQTLKPDIIELVNDPPLSDNFDITYRYRIGYDRLRGKNLDCILLIENDDYYSPHYIERMVEKWVDMGKPQLLGHQYTIYYHMRVRAWTRMDHFRRSSAMNTLIRPDMDFPWCVDNEVYTDIHLWLNAGLVGVTFDPLTNICLGIKHGIGKTGGAFHKTYLDRLKRKDPEFKFLKQYMDPESYKFYTENEDYFIASE